MKEKAVVKGEEKEYDKQINKKEVCSINLQPNNFKLEVRLHGHLRIEETGLHIQAGTGVNGQHMNHTCGMAGGACLQSESPNCYFTYISL